MERLYQQKKYSPRNGRMHRFLVLLLCVVLSLFLVFNFQLYPGIAALSRAAAVNRVQAIMANAFQNALAEQGELAEELVTLSFRADGAVSSLSCHMGRLNSTRNTLLLSVIEALRANDYLTVSIPLGNLFGAEILSGRGPRMAVRILVAQGTSARMESEFAEQGINQTLHRVLFSVSVNLTVLTPSHPQQLTVTQSYAVSETVIVGEVPDAYTEIHRLTDDVSEEDIDDLNDFGAHL